MLERVGELVRIDAALLGLENQTLRYGSVIDAIAAAKKSSMPSIELGAVRH